MKYVTSLLIAGGAFAIASTAAQAAAVPTLSYEVFVNGALAFPAVSSTTGTLGTTAPANALPAGFSALSFTATGVPNIPSPDLATISSISTGMNFGSTSQTIELIITQTNLSTPSGIFSVTVTSDLNNLIGGGVTTTSKTFVDSSNTAFGEGATAKLVSSQNGIAGQDVTNGAGGETTAVNVGTGLYSETRDVFATFTGNSETLTTNNQLLTSVPEPASIALIGSALFGLGMIRRRKRS